ncbi:MAG TPA: hypothetical protein VF519_02150 [Mycobacteriales bacterium]|jgi:hypothetical protein
MRALLALAVAAAAFAAPAAQAACYGPNALNACVSYGCTGHPCVLDPTSAQVTVNCNHPTPPNVCALLSPRTR